MLRTLFAAIAALLSISNAAQAQFSISLDESKIRAVLKNNSTVVVIPISSSADHSIKAQLSLAWLSIGETESSQDSREVLLQPGQSAIETLLPITESSIWTRLRYSLAPDPGEARVFAPISGIVSLSRIADYVFELKLGNAGVSHRGSRLSVFAEVVHPVTRSPISGIEWKSKLLIDEKEVAPESTNNIGESFAEFVFDIPDKPDAYRQESAKVEVSGRLGDFEQKTTIRVPLYNRFSGRVQSDKPIYQPGQTMHLRAVIFNFQGRAAQGAKIKLNINNVHTAHLVSSRFGIIQDEWKIPETESLGIYRIILTLEDRENIELARHEVRVSRYELPAFTVTAKPDRTAYLPTERPRVTVAADYLFGKPVPRGHVKIVQYYKSKWNPEKRTYELMDETVAEGEAGGDGKFVAPLDLGPDFSDLQQADRERFRDIHFAAYYRDVTSGRTEQRRFDIRITLEPIHIYVIKSSEGGLLPAALYISTSYADGRPASADVEILFPDRTMNLHTNKYGVGKIPIQDKDYEDERIQIRAVDAAGITGKWEQRDWNRGVYLFRLETSHTIHRAGEPVKLRITSPPDSPADQLVLICAISGDKKIAGQVVRLTNHKGEATFPYQTDFQRTVSFVAWNAVDARANFISWVLGSRTVIFPDNSDLKISAATERKIYKPGEKASLQMRVASADGKPVEAAIGLAVVDQAVLERAGTDNEFGHRPWFACAFCGDPGEEEIGGVRLNDFYAIKPEVAISPELDLVAESMSVRHSGFINSQNGESTTLPPQFMTITLRMQQIETALNNSYLRTLEIPQDVSALTRMGLHWSGIRDPWGMPYAPKFSVAYGNNILKLWSAGPDKKFETEDDFVVHAFWRPYFLPIRHLINEALRERNYPATDSEFSNLLRDNGLLFSSLRDPWGSPYRANVRTEGRFRRISIMSAGPDRQFQTRDDFSVADFSGNYFQKEKAQIDTVLQNSAVVPQTTDEFLKILKNAGVDISRYRDAWDRPYLITSAENSRYGDRVQYATAQIYGGTAALRQDVVPVTKHFIAFSLHSIGPDGIENTNDDFDIAGFPVFIREEAAQPEFPGKSQPTVMLQGTGLITGVIKDSAGSVVMNVAVTLVNAEGMTFETITDQNGAYYFRSVPKGIYSIAAILPGFYKHEVSKVPVVDGKTTSVDIELQVAARQDAVEVLADSGSLILESSSSVGTVVSYSTPRVREYFPETLFWIPELITDANGLARTQIPPADSVTTWKIAVAASTLDGRFAQTESEFRTFQPFFLDFNPPSILTEGDQIELPVAVRNYRDRAQKVNVSLVQNEWSAVKGGIARQVTVPANGSVNATYVIQAKIAKEKAAQRITADAGSDRDAIERSLRVHPDGQEITRTQGDLVSGPASFNIAIPQNAIKGATRGELRLYPNIASLLLESASAILAAPHGCAEQTISAGYANLIAWRFARAAGIQDPKIEERALKNIRLALDRLNSFQDGSGGVRYWNTSAPDIAVTAYALGFLIEASAVVPLDEEDLSKLVSWLEKQQAKDGRWMPRNSNSDLFDSQSLLLTSTVLRSLAAAQKEGIKVNPATLGGAYHHIAQFTDNMDEPYMLANFILAALDSGDEALVGDAAKRLAALGREERGGVYWDLQTNSPFYGWGTAGRYETTGLAVSALSAWRTVHPNATELDAQIRRGLVFLIRGRDQAGSWFSTQSTVRAMRALVDASRAFGNFGGRGRTIEIRSNEQTVKTINVPDDSKATDPVIVDLSLFLSSGDNQISLMPSSGIEAALVLLSSTYWLPWEQTKPRTSPELRLNVRFDKLEMRAGAPVRCSVRAERVGFRGYGMMLAEIGLPPGAEVDRASLERVIYDGSRSVDHYEILPDRVVLYLWPSAGGSVFDFYLSTRMPMTAKSAPSVLYDYYNPEALSELAPSQWSVK